MSSSLNCCSSENGGSCAGGRCCWGPRFCCGPRCWGGGPRRGGASSSYPPPPPPPPPPPWSYPPRPPPPPPSPPPPSRPPTNWKFSITTVSLLRLPPPCLSSQESNLSRPSMKIGLPFWKYWLMTSACLPNEVTSTNVTSSLSSPLAVRNLRLQATPNSTTAVWLGRYFSCGSRVRLPISRTLLKLAMMPSILRWQNAARVPPLHGRAINLCSRRLLPRGVGRDRLGGGRRRG